MSAGLSYVESMTFVQEHLHLNNCKRLLLEDRHQVLCEITRRLHQHSPWHNLFLLAQKPESRRTPEWVEVKSQMLSGAGGLCYPRNLFTLYLLRALGFQVRLAMATMLPLPGTTHIALIVENVKQKGDKHLVDVSVGLPSLEPVDLGFEKESPEFIQSHYRFKYIKEEGKITRLQRLTTEGSGEYRRRYCMCVDDEKSSQISHGVELIYRPTDRQANALHEVLCCTQYYEDGRIRMIKGNVFTRDTDNGNVERSILETEKARVRCILENFPQISKSLVMKAIKNAKKVSASTLVGERRKNCKRLVRK